MKHGGTSRGLSLALASTLTLAGCDADEGAREADAAVEFDLDFDETAELPDPAGLGKADFGLVSGPVTIYLVGAAIALVAGGYILYNASEDLADVLAESSYRAPSSVTHAETESLASFIGQAMNRVAHKTAQRYVVAAGDFVQWINWVDRGEIDSALAFGSAASAFMSDAQRLAAKAKTDPDYEGGCVVAKVFGKRTGITYEGRAAYSSRFDILAAVAAASIYATTRCGAGDVEVAEALAGAIPDSPPSFSIDTFISYGWHSLNVMYAYRGACQLPPSLAITKDRNACY